MKRIIFSALVLAFSLSACRKSIEIIPECERNDWGTIQVRSFQDESFYIHIDGHYKGVVGAYGTVEYEYYAPGTYFVRMTEVNYILNQDAFSGYVTVNQCQTNAVNF